MRNTSVIVLQRTGCVRAISRPLAAVMGRRGRGWPMRPLLVKILAVVLVTGLALTITGCTLFAVAVRRGIAPDFDQRIALDARHILVIHNGPSPICSFIPNPPRSDCLWPGSERREFSVTYLTPHGVRSLLWFRLP